MTWRAPPPLPVARMLTSLTSKPAPRKPLCECRIGPGRPDGQNAARPQRGVRRLQPGWIVERIIGLAGQAFRTVIDVEQDGIELRTVGADDFGNIGFPDAHAGIAKAVAKNFRHRAARPGDDGRDKFNHHDLRLVAERTERGTQRKAHAEAADEQMRFCDLFDLLRRERRQCGLRAREAAVHQLVGAEHDGELLAAAHQAEFIVGAGNAGGVDLFPGNHAAGFSTQTRVIVRLDRTIQYSRDASD